LTVDVAKADGADAKPHTSSPPTSAESHRALANRVVDGRLAVPMSKGGGTELVGMPGTKPGATFGVRQELAIMNPFVRGLGGMAAVGRDGRRA
jgi:hypothetical protein